MTPYQEWLMNQSADFKRGFNAYHEGLTDDISESEEWHRGYDEAQRVDDQDNQKFV